MTMNVVPVLHRKMLFLLTDPPLKQHWFSRVFDRGRGLVGLGLGFVCGSGGGSLVFFFQSLDLCFTNALTVVAGAPGLTLS